MRPVHYCSLLLLLAAAGCAQAVVQAPGPLEGAWLVDEIRMSGPQGESVNPSPQPGLYIFSGRHYSIAVYECRFEGDALWLTMTDNDSHDGVQDPGVLQYRIPVKLVRAESRP